MSPEVTVSTKCWEGDHRLLLQPAGLRELFGPLGPAARRQVVLNRIADREDATRRAEVLIAAGELDEVAWAEDLWPALARRLAVPETWFGPAWPYAVPELAELALARTPVMAHLAGDVRLEPGPPWLPGAVRALAAAGSIAAVSPVSPSRIELVRPEARGAVSGWVANYDFSDQCFLVRPTELLVPEVARAVHPAAGRYPKPGGALTFEARVGAWLRGTGRVRLVDVRRGYLHPVGGAEGSSYAGLGGPPEHLPPVPRASASYPLPGSVAGTGLVVARDAVRGIGATVASLRWLSEVIVVDQASTDGTAERAAEAGATVWHQSVPTVTGRAVLDSLVEGLSGWVVHLDADEVAPPGLAHALAELFAQGQVDGVEAWRVSHRLGHLLPGGPRDPQLRAVRAGHGVYPWGLEALRMPIELTPGSRRLRIGADPATAVVHLGQPDLHSWLARANDRTTLEARGTEVPGCVSGRRAAKRFVLALTREGLWRGGVPGWRLAGLEALQRWLLTEKAAEAVQGGRTAALAAYDEIAFAVLAGELTPPP